MTSELDIWRSRSAKLLVDQYGADAPIRAAPRADELLAAGDIEGRATWLRTLAAVKELMATKPPGRVHRWAAPRESSVATSRHGIGPLDEPGPLPFGIFPKLSRVLELNLHRKPLLSPAKAGHFFV